MNILVLSRNAALYSTNSIVRAGEQRGHFMDIIDHTMCDLLIQRGNSRLYFEEESIYRYDAVIPRIGSSVTRTGATVIRQFEGMNIFSALSAEALLRSRNKISCLQILAKKDIPIPRSYVCNNVWNLSGILNKVKRYPVIIKLANSTHGLGVLKAESRSAAESIVESFLKLRQKCLIQEFIKEAAGEDVRAFVVDGKIVASMRRKAEGDEFRSNLHRGGIAEKIELSELEKSVALKSTKILGLNIAGVDMLRSKYGPLVLEVNASPGLEGIETITGVDIAGKIIDFVERNANKGFKRYS